MIKCHFFLSNVLKLKERKQPLHLLREMLNYMIYLPNLWTRLFSFFYWRKFRWVGFRGLTRVRAEFMFQRALAGVITYYPTHQRDPNIGSRSWTHYLAGCESTPYQLKKPLLANYILLTAAMWISWYLAYTSDQASSFFHKFNLN